MPMPKPNIIIIMTDDQGYADLSCMGSTDFVTPNIDALAENGARFTCMYSNSPVCSPSRAALLTGRYPANAGVRTILQGHRKATGISPEVPTIAEAVKKLGYDTACLGKWHLGGTPECRPNANGFDYFKGFIGGCVDYYSHIFYWGSSMLHDLWENETHIHDDGKYMTELISEKAVEYIREKGGKTPFLLYLGYNAPHYPMHAPKKYMDRFKHLPWDRQVMCAMISAVDDGVGDITAELKRKGILENTIIYYQSDNGPSRETRNWLDGTPDPYYGGSAGIFKGHKFSLFEGGIRVPGIVSYPGNVAKGQVINVPVASMDIFPTVLEAAGGNPDEYALDGKSLNAVLNGSEKHHEYIFWEISDQTAVRHGDYKLVLNGRLTETEPPQDEVFLADLSNDPSESVNLADKLPDVTEKLKKTAEEWRENVGARIARP
jgi:arylsulfatase A-like enzyme